MKLLCLLISLMLALSPAMSQAESSKGNKKEQEIPSCVDKTIPRLLRIDSDIKGFRLYTQCRGMEIAVGVQQSKSSKFDLTKKAIRNTVESRLRSARLYDAEADQFIEVYVNTVGNAFSTSLQFKKYLNDDSSGTSWWAVTWENGYTGTHSNDSGFILSGISTLMDGFLVEYLRVNEKACEWRSRQK